MASQRFCLRWNNHQSNMLSVFDQLLHAETFTDVTLAAEGQLLKAHKMVLSACSPYFQALFVNHQEKHPIVILKDVPYADMKCLLDFMYRGEVSVDQERLTAFLKVAESLRIKGLTEVNEEKCDLPALTNSLLQQQSGQTPPPQLHRIQNYGHKRHSGGMPSGGAPPNLLMPLLGNALMQPKRKRGRPRKLSGSSSDAVNTAASPPGEFMNDSQANRSGDQLIRGSPEMLEVKMSMDNFNADDGATSGGEDAGEALLIDEGDDAQSAETPATVKDNDSTDVCQIPESSRESHYSTVGIPATFEDKYLYDSDEVIITENVELFNLDLNSDNSQETIGNLSKGICKEVIVETSKHDEPEKKESNAQDENDTQRSELLEYLLKADGCVICKLCGEVLESRSHWYRHKYKVHIVHQPLNAAPIYQCDQCLVFFKTKKGYIGHVETQHNVTLSDTHPPLNIVPVDITSKEITNERNNASTSQKSQNYNLDISISKKVVPNQNAIKNEKKSCKIKVLPVLTDEEKEEQRLREERLVFDIINRVKKECDEQGASSSMRKGYTKRTTVMNIQ